MCSIVRVEIASGYSKYAHMNDSYGKSIVTGSQSRFSNSPPWWFKTLSWTFPLWTIFVVAFFMQGLDYSLNLLGYPISALVPSNALPQLFLIIPMVLIALSFVCNNWFRRKCIYLLCINYFWLIFLGMPTQGALSRAAWHICGRPIQGTLKEAESCPEGKFLPNRCNPELNLRATLILKFMNEKQVCEQLSQAFICRLLTIDLDCAPICYRIESSQNGGTLYYKRLNHEPIGGYPGGQGNALATNSSNKAIFISPAQLTQLSTALADAKNFYNQNKFHTVEYEDKEKQYLLEFQVAGKYYYYSFLEDEPRRSDARDARLEPPCIQKIKEICEDAVRSN